ncbi:hypothetical protein KFK09_024344 [Dendrobium nobile]|uniref:Uncharacterized protein n=1 Tax=Dendrobium nobile TaxID=94219 RepID=A0A8T3ADT7_DENNO|nr:hypothetical protein KFK09_024344 [Dendrobium nobile]
MIKSKMPRKVIGIEKIIIPIPNLSSNSPIDENMIETFNMKTTMAFRRKIKTLSPKNTINRNVFSKNSPNKNRIRSRNIIAPDPIINNRNITFFPDKMPNIFKNKRTIERQIK